ncbi:hypothetical protein HMPREF3150_00545 [Pseudomonas aeruginosa]|nr:hypothetical protein HMPREF3150_00545 [Pseudomonas aeruginosa]
MTMGNIHPGRATAHPLQRARRPRRSPVFLDYGSAPIRPGLSIVTTGRSVSAVGHEKNKR